MYCADCESVEDYFFEKVSFFWIFLPTTESFTKLARFCGEQQLAASPQNSHCIRVMISEQAISNFLTSLQGLFEAPELAGTKITTTATDEIPDLTAMGRMTTLDVLTNRYKAKWLIQSIEQENYQTWFQPIVRAKTALTEPQIYANEGLFRIKDQTGSIVPPHLAFMLAEQSELLFSLDLVARRSAVQHFAAARLSGKLFINFNPSSIYDASYCLRSTAAAIYDLGLKPSDIVFEVTETHKSQDINHLKGILTFYRNAGFQVAIDDIGSGWSSLNLLQKLRPDYVKIDMELVRDIHFDVFKQTIVASLINIARSNGIQIIAEGIEVEEEAKWLIDNQVDLLQGYYFGRPSYREPTVSAGALQAIQQSVSPLKDAAAKR